MDRNPIKDEYGNTDHRARKYPVSGCHCLACLTADMIMNDKTAVPCIICNKELENLFEDENHPAGGTSFITYGHYGSTAFDPMDGTYLEINICDECIQKNKNKVLHVTTYPAPAPYKTYKKWKTEEGE